MIDYLINVVKELSDVLPRTLNRCRCQNADCFAPPFRTFWTSFIEPTQVLITWLRNNPAPKWEPHIRQLIEDHADREGFDHWISLLSEYSACVWRDIEGYKSVAETKFSWWPDGGTPSDDPGYYRAPAYNLETMVRRLVTQRNTLLQCYAEARSLEDRVKDILDQQVTRLVHEGAWPTQGVFLPYLQEAFGKMVPEATSMIMSNWDAFYYHACPETDWFIPLRPEMTNASWVQKYEEEGRLPVWLLNLLIALRVLPMFVLAGETKLKLPWTNYLRQFANHVEDIRSVPGFILLFNKSRFYRDNPERLSRAPPELLEAKRLQKEGARRRWRALVYSWTAHTREMHESSLWYVD